MNASIKKQFKKSLSIVKLLLEDEDFLDKMEQMSRIMISCLRNGNAIYLAGNGGSAAQAQHLAAELSGRFELDRPPLNAEALHVNTSYLTAVANDYGYEHIFSRILRGKGRKGDVFIALSTSGNSSNIIQAVEAATARQMTVLGFAGRNGGALSDMSDVTLRIPTDNTARIQEIHLMIGHWLCGTVEQELFGDNNLGEEE